MNANLSVALTCITGRHGLHSMVHPAPLGVLCTAHTPLGLQRPELCGQLAQQLHAIRMARPHLQTLAHRLACTLQVTPPECKKGAIVPRLVPTARQILGGCEPGTCLHRAA